MSVDIDAVATLIAETAAEIMVPRWRQLAAHEVSEKGPDDLVTVVDQAMEDRLEAALTATLPGSTVVGEEAASRDPQVLDRLDDDERVWVIDPLDGTHNFVHGRDRVAVIVALVERRQTVAGWIHEPLSGRTAVTERGGGARLNGKPMAPRGGTEIADLQGNLSLAFFPKDQRDRIKGRARAFKAWISYRCAGSEYVDLCSGHLNFALYRKIMPWDHAAGALMIREAGGVARLPGGGDYRPTDRSGGLLSAASPATWQAVYDHLFS